MVNSLLQLPQELLKWGQTPPAPQPWSAAPCRPTQPFPWQGEGFGDTAPTLTIVPKAAESLRQCLHHLQSPLFIQYLRLRMLQPHLRVATPRMPPHPGAPAAAGPCLVRVVGKAGTHPSSQLLHFDSIKALTAPATTASGLQ